MQNGGFEKEFVRDLPLGRGGPLSLDVRFFPPFSPTSLMPPRRLSLGLAVLFLLLLARPGVAHAQTDLTPRLGLGVQALVSTEDGIAPGLRLRASAPLNADVSAAADLGLTGFVLQGSDNATYLLEPQLSVVVNLPSQGANLPYLLTGVGGHFPLSDENESESGPVLHLGLGRVQALMDTSIFYEVNPGLLIADENVELLLPFRIGIIFR